MELTADNMRENWIKDGTDASFGADVIEASQTTPVIVDFWAPWCGPCKQLGPALEKVVTSAAGKVLMVKINVDENPQIAGQLQVKSIPAVYGFKDGKPVDGFAGALPASDLQKFVDRLCGDVDTAKEVAELVARAEQSLQLGDMGGAAQDLAAALQLDAQNPTALAGMARVYLANDDMDGARGVLEMARPEDQEHAALSGVRTQMQLLANAPGNDELQRLAAMVADDPSNKDARYTYAEALSGAGDLPAAVEQCFAIVQEDLNWQDQKARKMLLKLFEAAGTSSELTIDGRKRLSSLLFV